MADDHTTSPFIAPGMVSADPVAARQDALKYSATKPDTGAAKLRAFEDKHLGRKAMRSKEGHVEKGYGSPFKALSPELHAEHAALEKLVEAEAKVDAANAELGAAKVAVETAKLDVAAAIKVSDAAAAEAKKVADEEAKANAAPVH